MPGRRMLGVIGNLAPLYARRATGDSILRAAAEVQMLAIAITTSIWPRPRPRAG